jgi:hypothetical protein
MLATLISECANVSAKLKDVMWGERDIISLLQSEV